MYHLHESLLEHIAYLFDLMKRWKLRVGIVFVKSFYPDMVFMQLYVCPDVCIS